MHLKRIEIKGFKSFANKTILEFPEPQKNDKGITAIVGPNGAGKSNIVDAIRWALGEQSIKLLRGKKSQDVIFHGSSKQSRLGMAEVSLFIDNKDKTIPIEYSELLLTRKLYRNGESVYLINKVNTKLSDIIMLLAKANFGQKSFSIIGQGMIDYILFSGFKEKKLFFDEAVGVRQYQIKKFQTVNDLEKAKNNLSKIKIVLTELEPHLKLLSRQAKKLEKQKNLKQKLKDLQIKYYSNIYYHNKEKIEESNSRLKEKKMIDVKFGEQLLDLQKEFSLLSHENNLNKKFNDLKQKFDFFINKKNEILREFAFLKGEIDLKYKKMGKFDLIWLRKNKDELIKQKNKIKNDLEYSCEESKEIEKKLKEYQNKKNILSNQLEEISKKIKQLLENNKKKESNKINKESIKKIIISQKELIEQIKTVKEIKDIKRIEQKAKTIKQSLDKMIQEDEVKQNESIKKKIFELANIENNLINQKNKNFESLNKLEIAKNVNKEKNKILQSRIIETAENLKKIESEIDNNKPKDSKTMFKNYQIREQKINIEIKEIDKKILVVKKELDNFNKKEQEKRDGMFSLQNKIQEQQIKINQNRNIINKLMIEFTKLETQKENLEIEINKELKNIDYLNKSLIDEDINIEKINRLKSQLELIGGIDPETTERYEAVKKRYNFVFNQIKDLEASSEKLKKIIINLDKIIKNKFDKSFIEINKNFNKYFKILFNGGEAKLIKTIIQKNKENNINENSEIIEANDNKKEKEEIGIEIKIAPLGKKLKDINIFSGGERSLTSIALICAIISTNPSPFVILDEVDASLDEINATHFAKIIKNLSYKTQFIAISHNRTTMEAAKILYGVTMQEKGISKILSLSLEDVKKTAEK
ncbi:MAG: AAA family ATPase [Xanthomonadaceae bacterium]|nr:AAA family ATPase [Rhodospirillaceae bacterium]NIA18072.1 AAA family ATPase [Xanthomonadaceae bacterium]